MKWGVKFPVSAEGTTAVTSVSQPSNSSAFLDELEGIATSPSLHPAFQPPVALFSTELQKTGSDAGSAYEQGTLHFSSPVELAFEPVGRDGPYRPVVLPDWPDGLHPRPFDVPVDAPLVLAKQSVPLSAAQTPPVYAGVLLSPPSQVGPTPSLHLEDPIELARPRSLLQ